MDLPGPEPDDRPDATDEAASTPTPEAAPAPVAGADLERIAGDLADIELALDRLSDGSYWTDEITGETIPDAVLAEDPTARRVAYVPTSQQATDESDTAADSSDPGSPPTVS
jgi:RNA polymerase-binding transcription factor DksA